jgi:hypothetical protein
MAPFTQLPPDVPMYGGPGEGGNACLCNLVEYNLLRVSAVRADLNVQRER